MDVPKIIKMFTNSALRGRGGLHITSFPHKLHPLGLQPMRTRSSLGLPTPRRWGPGVVSYPEPKMQRARGEPCLTGTVLQTPHSSPPVGPILVPILHVNKLKHVGLRTATPHLSPGLRARI